MHEIKRGDIFYADLNPFIGSEQGGVRPVVIIQNDIGNKYSPTVIAAAITSQLYKAKLPTHIEINGCGLRENSIVCLEQIRTIDKCRLREYIGHLDAEQMQAVNLAIVTSLGIQNKKEERTVAHELMTIQGVRGFIDNNGTAQLNLEDVSRGLGFVETKGDYIRWQRVDSYLKELGFSTCGENIRPEFIPENIFYRLAMKAKNETAETFQAKVADEILPSIRKTGGYYAGLSKELQAMFVTDKKVQKLEAHVAALDEKVDNEIRLTYNQATEIQRTVASRVIELLGGKESEIYKTHKGSYFQQLHRDLKDRLGVPSYRDIRKLDYENALAYIKAWLPKATGKSA